jgi:hypothetical protein
MARGEITGKKPVQTADEAKRLPGPPIADATAIEPTAKSELDAPTKANRRSVARQYPPPGTRSASSAKRIGSASACTSS